MFFPKVLLIALIFSAAICIRQFPAFSDPVEIAGKVVTSDGKPAVGARIHFLALSNQEERHPFAQASATAQENGSFFIYVSDSEMKTAKESRSENVLLATYGAETGFVDVDSDKFKKKIIELKPNVSIKFHVVDQSGAPVPDIAVAVKNIQAPQNSYSINWGNEAGEPWKALSDQNGDAVLSKIPIGSSIRVGIDSNKYAPLGESDCNNVSPGYPSQTIRVAFPGSISGKVVYSDSNHAVANLNIVAAGRQDDGNIIQFVEYHAKTDSDGNYTLSMISPGTYTIVAGIDGEMTEEWTAAPKFGVKVEADKTSSDANISLIRGAILTGRVTEKNTGKPLTDYRIDIRVEGNSTSSSAIANIHGDGTYKIHVPPGNIRIMAYALYVAMLNENDAIQMNLANGDTKTLDFQVDSAPAPQRALKGVALDAKGVPIANANVSLYSTGMPPRNDITDSKGNFKFGNVRSGDLIVAYANKIAIAEPVKASVNDAPVKIVLSVPISFATGKVVDQDGKPIKGANVSLDYWPDESGGMAFTIKQTISDAAGRYRIGPIYRGLEYSVGANLGGYKESWTAHFDLSASGPNRLGNLKLEKRDSQVSGVYHGHPLAETQDTRTMISATSRRRTINSAVLH
jgi:protocatechuate 3,4-dioxygenase beta subunit